MKASQEVIVSILKILLGKSGSFTKAIAGWTFEKLIPEDKALIQSIYNELTNGK